MNVIVCRVTSDDLTIWDGHGDIVDGDVVGYLGLDHSYTMGPSNWAIAARYCATLEVDGELMLISCLGGFPVDRNIERFAQVYL